MYSLYVLLALVACKSPEADSGNNVNDGGSVVDDTGIDTGDGGSVNVKITMQLPPELTGRTDIPVVIGHDCVPAYDGEDTCTESAAVTDVNGESMMPYVYNATASAKYWLTWGDHNDAYGTKVGSGVIAIYKKADFTTASSHLDTTETWLTNGCADAGWDPTSGACSDFVPGEWSMDPTATYWDDYNHTDVTFSVSRSTDVNNDGQYDLVISFTYADYGLTDEYVAAGTVAYSADANRVIKMSSDLSAITVFAYDGNGNLDGSVELTRE